MKLTVLTENMVNKRGLLAEHGLSVLVEAAGRRILFDTGQSDVYVKNAAAMGVSLAGLDAVVLSHGHYDHCGGLAEFPAGIELPPVFVGKGAFGHKLCMGRNKTDTADIGIPRKTIDFLSVTDGGDNEKASENFLDCPPEGERRADIRPADGLTEIFPDIFLLNRIPCRTDFEGVSPAFLIEKDGRLQPDPMQDEQLLCIREKDCLHMIAGCCHVGIISCLTYAKEQFPDLKPGLVFAGMHLRGAGRERLDRTIEEIRKLKPACLVPVHCTGMEAIVKMKKAFGERCKTAEAGKVIVWEM